MRSGSRRPWKRLFACVCLLLFIGDGVWAAKRIAILYIEDNSGFDPPSGCGCLPLGPLGAIFGRTRRQRQYWNLEVGFRDMLVTTLQDAPGYEAVHPEEVMAAYAELGTSQKGVKDEAIRRELAEHLKASVLVVGRIKRFKQERAMGLIRRDVTTQSQPSAAVVQGATGTLGVLGSFYKADVTMQFRVYSQTGAEAYEMTASDSKTFQSGTVKSGPIEARVSSSGTLAFVGSQQIAAPSQKPAVVRHDVLDHVRFGVPRWDRPSGPNVPPNYRDTLLGRVTQTVLDKFIEDMRERIGPSLEDAEPDEERSASGKVAFTTDEGEDVYINVGSKAKLRIGDRLEVFRETQQIRDPDTGEVLGGITERVGTLEIVEVMRPKLSRTRVLDGSADVGDVVKLLPKHPAPNADQDPTTD